MQNLLLITKKIIDLLTVQQPYHLYRTILTQHLGAKTYLDEG